MRHEDDKGNFIEFKPLLMPDRYELMDDIGFKIGSTSKSTTDLLKSMKVIAKLMRYAGPNALKVQWTIGDKKHTSWDSLTEDAGSAHVLTQASIAFCFSGMGGGKK